jgi:hypothetical protein
MKLRAQTAQTGPDSPDVIGWIELLLSKRETRSRVTILLLIWGIECDILTRVICVICAIFATVRIGTWMVVDTNADRAD